MKLGRKTISLDTAVEEKLRDIQSKFIKSDTKSWSLSKIVNMVLMSAILNSNDMAINDWNNLKTYLNGRKPDLSEADTEKFVSNILYDRVIQ